MLSKCANPECSEILRYLHQGKIFCLSPTPEGAKCDEYAAPGVRGAILALRTMLKGNDSGLGWNTGQAGAPAQQSSSTSPIGVEEQQDEKKRAGKRPPHPQAV